MKLYIKSTKRFAKKIIGKDWSLLNLGCKMKIGDLVQTCKGYNDYITKITPVYQRYSRACIIVDFDVETSDGYVCSFLNCCTYPAPDGSGMFEYFRNLIKNYPDPEIFGKTIEKIYKAISNNINPFNELGMVKEEYV